MNYQNEKDEVRDWYLKVSKRTSNETISDIWENNIEQTMLPIIHSNEPVRKKLDKLFQTNLFAIQPDPSSCEFHLDWHISLLKKNGFNLSNLPEDFEDHDLINCMYNKKIDGRRMSPDFAHRAHYLNEMDKHFKLDEKRLTIAELGSGCGGLARMLKLKHKQSCYLIFDLPETIYLSGSFLKEAFPKLKTLFVEEDTDISNYKEYDFVFVPAGLENKFKGIEIDLFINIHSLGEMPNEVISKWINFIEQVVNVKNIFLLNRFMSPFLQKNRANENQASLLLGKYWNILKWDYEPEWQRSPYNEISTHPALLIIASKDNVKAEDSSYRERSMGLLERAKLQDWYQLVSSKEYHSPGMFSDIISISLLNLSANLPHSIIKFIKKMTLWNSKSVRHAFIYYINGRILVHPIISGRLADFTMSGTMFQLWESIRLHPNLENVGTMIKYFEFLSVGKFIQYEEYYFYKDLYEKLMVKA
tara:strand:+ start:1038 stop:2456 length:1419 start_codon:yes stop_codon:yes gene_type:complete